MAPRKPKATATPRRAKRDDDDSTALGFDPTVRSDKLRAWLHTHPGELPPGMSAEEVTAILGE